MLFRSNDTATTEIYTSSNTLSLHDALPISFQHATLVSDLTVFQNVQLGSENGASTRPRRSDDSADPEQVAAEALRLAGVDESMWERFADELNGGDQKLVDMARAFVGKPRVILLDES